MGTLYLTTSLKRSKREDPFNLLLLYTHGKKIDIFLIDTPGDSNFQGELPYQLVAADGILYVLDATDGVKPQDKKLWNEAKEFELPTVVVVNKMDRERADFEKALKGIQDVLKAKPMVKYYPIGSEADFKGVVDVIEKKAYIFKDDGKIEPGEVPGDLNDRIEELYEYSVENIAESDEELMEKYLEEGELTPEEIKKWSEKRRFKRGNCAGLCNICPSK